MNGSDRVSMEFGEGYAVIVLGGAEICKGWGGRDAVRVKSAGLKGKVRVVQFRSAGGFSSMCCVSVCRFSMRQM